MFRTRKPGEPVRKRKERADKYTSALEELPEIVRLLSAATSGRWKPGDSIDVALKLADLAGVDISEPRAFPRFFKKRVERDTDMTIGWYRDAVHQPDEIVYVVTFLAKTKPGKKTPAKSKRVA